MITRTVSPCFNCPALCCRNYVVPITAHDLWRMCRSLSVPWTSVAEVYPGDEDRFECFRLDDSERRFNLRLQRRESGDCKLLVDLPSGAGRCGAHDGRPFVCRTYPHRETGVAGLGVGFISHTMCPPAERDAFRLLMPSRRSIVYEELAEWELHGRVVERWNWAAARIPAARPLTVDDYLDWTSRLYDAAEPLRRGPRDGWRNRVDDLVDTFPTPALHSG